MHVNDYQVGGKHYAEGGSNQHWDFITDNGFGYLEGCMTKYVTRWRKKGVPVQDLEKAQHYAAKAIEKFEQKGLTNRGFVTDEMLEAFYQANNITDETDRKVLTLMFRWVSRNQLDEAIELISTELLPQARKMESDKAQQYKDVLKPSGRTEHPRPFGYDLGDDFSGR